MGECARETWGRRGQCADTSSTHRMTGLCPEEGGGGTREYVQGLGAGSGRHGARRCRAPAVPHVVAGGGGDRRLGAGVRAGRGIRDGLARARRRRAR